MAHSKELGASWQTRSSVFKPAGAAPVTEVPAPVSVAVAPEPQLSDDDLFKIFETVIPQKEASDA